MGTSDGLHTLEGFGSHWTLSKKPFPNDVISGQPVLRKRVDSSHALVTSVEWLSSTVIASGLKDSAIFLHDLRSGGSATRLQHTHSVAKIRKVDPYRLVAAGQNSVGSCLFPVGVDAIDRLFIHLASIRSQTSSMHMNRGSLTTPALASCKCTIFAILPTGYNAIPNR